MSDTEMPTAIADWVTIEEQEALRIAMHAAGAEPSATDLACLVAWVAETRINAELAQMAIDGHLVASYRNGRGLFRHREPM